MKLARDCVYRKLGTIHYDAALTKQQALVQKRVLKEVPDQLLLLEHTPVFTLGKRAKSENLLISGEKLAAVGAEIKQTNRGGDITFHGPGQIVGYPIVDLKPLKCDIKKYVSMLEETIILTLSEYGLTAGRNPNYTGVWVGEDKIGAIGVRVEKWVTYHGFAFNVNTNLDYFKLIIPCGISDCTKGVTSMEKLLNRKFDINEVMDRIARNFGKVFGRKLIREEEYESKNSRKITV